MTELRNTLDQTFCVIDVDRSMNCPYFVWYGFINLEEMKEACLKMLDTIGKTKSIVYLSDNSRSEGFDSDFNDWAATGFIPQLVQLGIKAHAIIVSKDIFANMVAEELERNLSTHFPVKFFDTVEAGKKWLGSVNSYQ